MLTSEQIKAQAKAIGFHLVGIASVTAETAIADPHLQTWLDQGYQAGMNWMANPKRQDIRHCLPGIQSVISLALNYYTDHQRPEGAEYAKIARYGWGRDYHKVMNRYLKTLDYWLHQQDPTIQTHYYADTGPLQDKVWAQRAGLGWIAKNGNVITRDYGSWVFLGEILTTLELTPDAPHTAHCGTCQRCIEACPTQAIPQPYVVNANRCIAYHTIENRAEDLPPEIKPHLQGWVAGCDICQDVCPWNHRFAKVTTIQDFHPYPQNVAPQLVKLANMGDADWQKQFPASALRRIKPAMFRRNARANLETASERNAETDTSFVK